MDETTWNLSEEHTDHVAESLDELFDLAEFEAIRSQLIELNKRLGNRYGIQLACTVNVVDWEEERSLTVLNMGLLVDDTGEVAHAHNDVAPQRYVVDGEICVVPDDYCPRCWKDWVFKSENLSCPSCGLTLGEECKILLDSDLCPHCGDGTISMNSPLCEKCGFTINPAWVVWG